MGTGLARVRWTLLGTRLVRVGRALLGTRLTGATGIGRNGTTHSRWRAVGRRRRRGPDHAGAGQGAGARRGGDGRRAVVHARPQIRIATRHLDLLTLLGRCRHMRPARHSQLRGRRPRLHPAAAAVEAHAAAAGDHRAIIDVGDVEVGDVVDGAIVVQLSVAPFAATVADAAIAEAIVDTAIESDRRTPVSGVEPVEAVVPAPIAGRPQKPDLWWLHPGAWHPVVVLYAVVPGPIARRPDVAVGRDRRLVVDRQRRRRETDVEADPDLRLAGAWRGDGNGAQAQNQGHRGGSKRAHGHSRFFFCCARGKAAGADHPQTKQLG